MLSWFRRKAPTPSVDPPVSMRPVPPPVSAPPAPPFVGPVRVVEQRGYRVELDLSTQGLYLGMSEIEVRRAFGNGLVPARTLFELSRKRAFVTAAALSQKAKQFDDGLYAAVDLAAQDAFKAPLLRRLAGAIAGGGSVAGTLLGAARLGGVDVAVPSDLEETAQRAVDSFLADPLRSKPLGFYTWSEPLSRIFRQDRMLQSELTGGAAIEALLHALETDAAARTKYEAYLTLAAGLTNRLSPDKPDLRSHIGRSSAIEGGVYFFPPSRSHEGDLMERLFGDRSIPDGFNLMEEVIRLIRRGGLDLRPRDDSGWYDYQTWALEPLVVPETMSEAARLLFSAGYLKHLEELFKGTLALARETHVKQRDHVVPGRAAGGRREPEEPPIVIAPDLSLEPLATHYLRRAAAYDFVRGVLERAFGEGSLSRMRRRTPDGSVEQPLDEELRHVTALFRGAASLVNCQLGFESQPGPEAAIFRDWASRPDDPDLGRDARMMVPVFSDIERGKTKVWVVLGWTERDLSIGFTPPPKYRVVDKAGQDASRRVRVQFISTGQQVAQPVFAEVYVSRLLDRREFRAHCDRYRSVPEILAHLE